MKNLFSALALGAALFLGACNKEEAPQNVSTVGGPFSTLQSVLDLYAAPSQTFTVRADSGGAFRAARGTRFIVPPFAFRRAGTTNDTIKGVVQITVREFLDRSEMIYSRVVPGNQPGLVSGGAFFFSIANNGLTTDIHNASPIAVLLPQRNFRSDAGNLQGYMGFPQTNVFSSVIWAPSVNTAPVGSVDFDTVGILLDTAGYHMPAFPNAVFNPGTGNEANVRFAINGAGLNAGNSILFLLPKGLRQVIPVGNAKSMQGATYKTQRGIDVYLVAMGLVNGKFQGGIVETKLEDTRSYGVSVSDTDPKEFKERILRLL